ncbi:MAG TPA: ABC transporter substrate-binding protein [Acidimicrobiia bacterium]|nr:ABC transporter substrate-binding protein [Acidimicrobiia bacterium]
MKERQRRVDAIRRQSSEVENHLIDEYSAGKISRREFIRRGTVVGMSLPVLSVLASCATPETGTTTTSTTAAGPTTTTSPAATTSTTAAAPTAVRNGIVAPAGAIDPVTVADEGGLAVLGQSGEYLAFSASDLSLRPVLAEEWTPNDDGSVWTFRLRQGVQFHDGTEMTANDVVATIEGVLPGNAASAFAGVLSAGNTRAVDDYTVEFTLDAPNGNFPYIVSSDNYNAIILPASFWAGYAEGSYEQSFIGTGPWQIENFETGVMAAFTKFPDYWDAANVVPDRIEMRFFADEPAMITAYQGGEIDTISHFSVANGLALLSDPDTEVLETQSSVHRQIHMATDMDPFTDKRTRQAMALILNRPDIVTGLFNGKADIGNDHPFAPVFPSTDPSVAQRQADLAQAQQLLAAAGSEGFTVELAGWNGFEMPTLGQLIQSAATEAGLTVTLNFTDPGTYYNNFWLSSPFGITDYGHRGVPNVFLGAPLRSDGTWNAAHFSNSTYDGLVDQYVAAFDLDVQRQLAGQIQTLLLDETPIIFPYFYYFLSAVRPGTSGFEVSAMGHVRLHGTSVGGR